MGDPYKVLGISSSATDEEVTAAYRRLAKKYHPDLNPGNPEAEKKMREINAAYEAIKTHKAGGTAYQRPDGSYGPRQQGQPGAGRSYRGEDPFGGFEFGELGDLFGSFFGGAWQQGAGAAPREGASPREGGSPREGASPMERQAHQYIQNRQYQDALRVLSQMPRKDAEWYYLSALANAGAGNRVTALNHAREAVRMEPAKPEYRRLLDQIQQGGFTYRQQGQRRGFDMQRVGRTMMQLVMAQMLCFCCCRPC